jgi:hypothetical protein
MYTTAVQIDIQPSMLQQSLVTLIGNQYQYGTMFFVPSKEYQLQEDDNDIVFQ